MPRYLLAAEADKIQDFIFRAARLREVVGGSRLLARFCNEGVKALREHDAYSFDPDLEIDVVINDGGAFRIAFEAPDESIALKNAKAFGRDLAELYRRCAGGVLTVAEPALYGDDEEDFKEASRQAMENLRKAKTRGDEAASAVHFPYLAFCASCGLAVARDHRRKNASNERANYICADCLNKTEEKYGQERDFIGLFREAVKRQVEQLQPNLEAKLSEPPDRDWVDVICKADPRNYIAYLVADGNGMGKLFSKCEKPKTMRNLSQALTQTLRESLAAPCAKMIVEQKKVRELDLIEHLAVVPLILGGDDLFALLPAPFALDIAAGFCRTYETKLAEMLNEIAKELDEKGLMIEENQQPTIAAAVVVCKSTYPHTLAHKRAEAALGVAKEMARRLEVDRGRRVSVLNFEVVTGNQVVGDKDQEQEKGYRSTLRPYFVRDFAADDSVSNWSINIEHLLKQRYELRSLPGKRRAEFEHLYAEPPMAVEPPHEADDLKERWLPDFNLLTHRIKRQTAASSPSTTISDSTPLSKALAQLGDDDQKEYGYWKHVRRSLTVSDSWYGHGMPDLLEAWDFAFQIDTPLDNYEAD